MAFSPNRRIGAAIITSIGSKSITLLVQIFAYPLAARTLGSERFGFLLVLVAYTGILIIPGQGVGPAIVGSIAKAHAVGDTRQERLEFWSGAWLAIGMAAAILACSAAAWIFLSPEALFGHQIDSFRHEASNCFYLLGFVAAGQTLSLWGEYARAGYQQQYLNNVLYIILNSITFGGIVLVAKFDPRVDLFFLAMFLPWITIACGNLIHLLSSRAKDLLWEGPWIPRSVLRTTALRCFHYGLVQLGTNLKLHGTVILAGRLAGLQASALLGAVMRLMMIAYGSLLMISQSFGPTIAAAFAKGDIQWARRAILLAFWMITAGALCIGSVMGIWGQKLLSLWVGFSIPADIPLFIFVGALNFSLTFTYALSGLLTTLGYVDEVGPPVVIEGVIAVALAALAMHQFGIIGALAALTFTILLVTGWLLPRKILKLAKVI